MLGDTVKEKFKIKLRNIKTTGCFLTVPTVFLIPTK